MVPPNAAPCAVLPCTCEAAKIDVASRPSQSPKEAAPSTSQSRRNGRMRSTARIAAYPLGETGAASPVTCPADSL